MVDSSLLLSLFYANVKDGTRPHLTMSENRLSVEIVQYHHYWSPARTRLSLSSGIRDRNPMHEQKEKNGKQ